MNISKYRKQAGLTQSQLGKILMITQRRTIGAWEADPKKLSLYTLEAYARACGVRLADLLGYDGESQGKLDKIKDIMVLDDIDREVFINAFLDKEVIE